MKKSLIFALFFSLITGLAFSATMNSRVRQVPKNIQEQIFENPKDTIYDLVKFLVGNSNDTGLKIRIMHDWICDNIAYDCDVFTEEGAGPQGYETVLKKRKAVCIGYANLLAVMCQVAKIDCEIVSGWSKGFGYRGYLKEESDHAWNAVKIAGKWKLIDVTWDAGFVERRTFIKQYTLQWYNLTPYQFGYSHLPEEEKWQLLSEKQVRTPEQFVKEPYVPGVFFEYGLSFGKDSPDYTNEIHEATSFDFVNSKNGVALVANIRPVKTDEDTRNYCWTENNGKTKRYVIDVPNKNEFEFSLGARTNGVINNPYCFSRSEFEQTIVPKAKNLLASKKITQKELDLFIDSYYLIEENLRYYYREDLFDNVRNSANTKILKLLEKNTSRYENVLTVTVKAAEDYEGYGNVKMRFPQLYQNYNSASTIKVNEPLVGVLKKGSEQHFSVSMNYFSNIALIVGENNDFVFFKKNPKTGAFELDYTIPEDLKEIGVFASKDNKSYEGIFSYSVE